MAWTFRFPWITRKTPKTYKKPANNRPKVHRAPPVSRNNNNNNTTEDPKPLENNNNNYRRKGNAIYASVYRGGKTRRR